MIRNLFPNAKLLAGVLTFAIAGFTSTPGAHAQDGPTLLNVSYDLSRDLYRDINPAFARLWKEKTGQAITINQSHGGSSRQALSVIGGLDADVVTMNQASDIDILSERGGLVAKDWRGQFPNGAVPYSSTTVFIVRKGNPKGIKDWDDLTRPGTQVIVPNPKTSGNGRYTYLGAWGFALKTKGGEPAAKAFAKALFANVPILDGGGRGATTTFAQRDIGDVLVTFENEFSALEREFGQGRFEIIYPSWSVDAAAPVAIVESVVTRRKSRDTAKAYLDFLFSPEGQRIIAGHHFRPSDPAILAQYRDRFPVVQTFKADEFFGGWDKIQRDHFADGANYDQIMGVR